jgi:hypothetical protein
MTTSDPYRSPAPSKDLGPEPITFESAKEEQVWREFLVAIVESGAAETTQNDMRCADNYLRGWRQRGGKEVSK